MNRYVVTVEERVVTLTVHRVVVRATDPDAARRAVDANWETVDWDHDELTQKRVLSVEAKVIKVE